jgi:two-component system sensor histidine kinase VicK
MRRDADRYRSRKVLVGWYAAGVALAAAAAAARIALTPELGSRSPFILFYPIILAVAWFGGLGPAIAAAVTSVLASPLLFPPVGRFSPGGPTDRASLVLYAAVVACLIGAVEAARRGRAAARSEVVRTREILDRLSAGFVIIGFDWRYVFVNPEAERLLGKPARDLVGRDAREAFVLAPAILERMGAALERREASELEIHSPRVNRWFLDRIFPVPDGAAVFFLDVTDRKRDEQAAADSQAILMRALEAAQQGFWTRDLESGVIIRSTNLEQVYGLPPESLGPTLDAFLERIHPDDRRLVAEAIQRAATEGSPYSIEFRVPTPDGSTRWISSNGRVETRDGRPVRLTSLDMDITDRLSAEERRRLLSAIVASSDDAIVSKDLHGRILSWNAAAERMYGYSTAEAVGQPITIIVPPDKIDEAFAFLDRIRRGDRVEHYETTRVRRDGTVLEVSLTVSPIYDQSGRIVGASKIARDISARRAAEREKQRTRELFLGILGHDLRNPLNTIGASLYSLEKNAAEPIRRAAARMSRATARMTRMIDQLLDFTRARLGEGIPVNPRESDLREICSAVVEEFEAQHPARVHLDAPAAAPGLWDADRMAQALSNLVGNALAHGAPEHPVDVRVSAGAGNVRLEVVNRGRPISEADQQTIFEPFRRTHASAVQDSSGLGLGLYIAREIVRAHRGSIEVASDPAETRFILTLPVAPVEAPEPN